MENLRKLAISWVTLDLWNDEVGLDNRAKAFALTALMGGVVLAVLTVASDLTEKNRDGYISTLTLYELKNDQVEFFNANMEAGLIMPEDLLREASIAYWNVTDSSLEKEELQKRVNQVNTIDDYLRMRTFDPYPAGMEWIRSYEKTSKNLSTVRTIVGTLVFVLSIYAIAYEWRSTVLRRKRPTLLGQEVI